jgi:uncharacterized protein (UPF0335 family)
MKLEEIIIWTRQMMKTSLYKKIKRLEELEKENRQLKIKLNNAYNELAVWKVNSKYLKKMLKGESNEKR